MTIHCGSAMNVHVLTRIFWFDGGTAVTGLGDQSPQGNRITTLCVRPDADVSWRTAVHAPGGTGAVRQQRGAHEQSEDRPAVIAATALHSPLVLCQTMPERRS